MEKVFNIEIQGDSEGYVTFECPFCGSEFKLRADEYQDDENPFEDLYCPYCGLSKNKNDFFTKELYDQIKALMHNYAVELLNETFGNIARSINRSNKKIIKMQFKPLKKIRVKEIHENDTVETAFECMHCNRHVKVLYCAGASKVFCPFCGVDIV